MLIECFGNHAKLQAFANAVREPIEYYEEEKCGRWYVDIQSHGDWSWAAAKIRDLSHDFRLVVYDGGIDGLGPSIFHQPGADWDAHYRVEMEDGYYRILDESWGCDAEAPDVSALPIYSRTVYRIQDGVHYDPPLIVADEDGDGEVYYNRESMAVYQCGDELSDVPMLAKQLGIGPGVNSSVATPSVRRILPEPIDSNVDWPKEGF